MNGHEMHSDAQRSDSFAQMTVGVLAERTQAEDLVAFFRRNVGFLIASVLLAVAAVTVVTLLAPVRYRATAMIRIVDERNALTGGIADMAANALGKAADPLLSQIQVMKSRSVLGEAIDSTWLRVNVVEGEPAPEFLAGLRVTHAATGDTIVFRFAPEGVYGEVPGETVYAAPGERRTIAGVSYVAPLQVHSGTVLITVTDRDLAIEHLMKNLRTRTRDKTDVVLVEFTHEDPALAQAVVNAVVDAFTRATMRSGVTLASRKREFIQGQLARIDSALAEATAKLTEFRRNAELYNSQQKAAAQQAGLVELQMRVDDLVSERSVYESLLRQLESSSNGDVKGMEVLLAAPSIASNIVVAQAFQRLIRYRTERDTLTSGAWGVSERHPDVMKLDTLIADTRKEILAAVRAQIRSLDAQVAALSERIGQARKELQSLPGAEQTELALLQEVEIHRRAAEQLQQELQKAYIVESVEAGQVEIVDRAPLPMAPVPLHWPLRIAGALVVGLVFGTGVSVLRERLDGTVRRVIESEVATRSPCFGVIPPISRDRKKNTDLPQARDVVAAARKPNAASDAYRSIRTYLAHLGFGKLLLVTSAQPGEGKTTTSANLAAAFARQGRRVLLVDADLRRPRVHTLFGMERGEGLLDINPADDNALRRLAVPGIDGLYVLTASGTNGHNPADMLDSIEANQRLRKLAEKFDLVIIDSPPILAAPDSSVLAHHVDGVLLVLRAGLSTVSAVRRAAQQVVASNGKLLGHVLNDPDGVIPLHDGSYYGYYGGAYGAA